LYGKFKSDLHKWIMFEPEQKWRTFDTKVMIAIGFLRWLFNYQRKEEIVVSGRKGDQYFNWRDLEFI